ncbi:hypothetical protein [Actinacidiphila acidipaludis]|uniref:Uncharacterized protein n=1 Tax=Actinacidiphila acidipaludis TaxID=2873382 RepID=A0ABS7Q269_9ACTN|nr:hypothetical protein [Streptomyces acidipaludis]MBY8876167.1 hypothetical protein [Streptomyces acidipaludis]
MERTRILEELAGRGTDTNAARCAEIAADLGLLRSDVLAVAGHPVPPELLPPVRDARVMREFAYRAGHCDHARMAALTDFIRSLPAPPPDPSPRPEPDRKVQAHPDAGPFAAVLDALIRHRGFGVPELPFMGLSLSTIRGSMLRFDRRDQHRWYRLANVAGPLGWRFEDVIAVAGEPPSERPRFTMHCHHLGQVYVAAIPLTTEQLVTAAQEADRLSRRPDQGAWRPVGQGFARECPDLAVEPDGSVRS